MSQVLYHGLVADYSVFVYIRYTLYTDFTKMLHTYILGLIFTYKYVGTLYRSIKSVFKIDIIRNVFLDESDGI